MVRSRDQFNRKTQLKNSRAWSKIDGKIGSLVTSTQSNRNNFKDPDLYKKVVVKKRVGFFTSMEKCKR